MDFTDSFARVNKWYNEIKQEYSGVYPKMKLPDDRKQFLSKYKNTITEMKKEIDCLNAEVEFIENDIEKRDVNNQIRIFEIFIDELENNWNREIYNDKNFDYNLFNEIKERQDQIAKINFEDKKNQVVQKIKLAAIDEGDKLYNEAMDRLRYIKDNIRVSSEGLAAINEEIRQQNYKLLEIDDLIRQSQNLFVRVKEFISFFTKTFLKDKCLNIMISFLVVLCVAIIVLIILQKAKESGDNTITSSGANMITGSTTTVGLAALDDNIFNKSGSMLSASILNVNTSHISNIDKRPKYQGTFDDVGRPKETAKEKRLRMKAYDGIYNMRLKNEALANIHDDKRSKVHKWNRGGSLLTSHYKDIYTSN